MIAQTAGGTKWVCAPECRQPAGRDGPRPLQRIRRAQLAEGGVDQRAAHSASAQLRPQSPSAVSSRGARRHPLARKRGIVDVPTRDEIHDHRRGHVDGRTPSAEPARQLGCGPGAAREQIGGDQSRATLIEGWPGGTYVRAKGLGGPGDPAGRVVLGDAFSNVSSPVEKMPRTFRSKSSGLEALCFAVSYAMTPSR